MKTTFKNDVNSLIGVQKAAGGRPRPGLPAGWRRGRTCSRHALPVPGMWEEVQAGVSTHAASGKSATV